MLPTKMNAVTDDHQRKGTGTVNKFLIDKAEQ
jgi:hypothetical protein